MDRKRLIQQLDSDEIVVEEECASTDGAGQLSEAERQVLKIREKKSQKGKIYGVDQKQKTKRLTPQMQIFVNAILAGKGKLEAYREAYDSATSNEAGIIANANRLLKDQRVANALGEMDEEFRNRVIDDAVRTRRFVMERLYQKVNEAKSDAAELKALELMGRAVAMFSDNVTQTVKNVDVSQLKQELKSHLSLLDGLKKAG